MSLSNFEQVAARVWKGCKYSSAALPKLGQRSTAALPFLDSVPEVAAKLKEPNTKARKFEDVVKSAEQAAVLVLVY